MNSLIINFIKDNAILIIIIVFFGGYLTKYVNPIIKIHETVVKDTVTVVKIDSISLIRTKAELYYLRTKLKQANGKIVYINKVDTVLVNDTSYIVPNFTANFDTMFTKGDELRVKYFYPQNQFDIYHKYNTINSIVNTTKTIETKRLFDFSHGIIVGAGYGVTTKKVDVFLGYGFKLGLNF